MHSSSSRRGPEHPFVVLLGLGVAAFGVLACIALAAFSIGMGNGGALVSATWPIMAAAFPAALVGMAVVKLGFRTAPVSSLVFAALGLALGGMAGVVLYLQDLAHWSSDSPWWDRRPGDAGEWLGLAALGALAVSGGIWVWRRRRAP